MVRRYNEPVEVKAREGMPCAPSSVEFDALAAEAVSQPEAFIWRGRLYVVREVLGHWRERRAWWREALDPPSDSPSDSPSGPPPGIAAAARERQVWRVDASPGRLARSGVFDLARDDPAEDTEDTAHAAEPTGWQLLRVAD